MNALANATSSSQAASKASPISTAATNASASDAHERGQPAAAAAGSSELARTKITLLGALKRFPDFPIPGINFIDILPLFQDVSIHATLLRALELQVLELFGEQAKPDVIVGLDARGFLFGPSLALRLGASFVPVRKKGKMPGPCVTAAYEKEYGTDFFQMQEGAVKPGQRVLIVDDIIATGECAAHQKRNLSLCPAPSLHLKTPLSGVAEAVIRPLSIGSIGAFSPENLHPLSSFENYSTDGNIT